MGSEVSCVDGLALMELQTVADALAARSRAAWYVGMENWYFIANYVVAAIALVTLPFVAFQTVQTKKAQQDQARDASGSLLWEIDRVFESSEMKKTRRALGKIAETVRSRMKDSAASKDVETFRSECKSEVGRYLDVAGQHVDAAPSIINYAGFFESVAVLVKRKALDFDTFYDLYRTAALQGYDVLYGHIIDEGDPNVFGNYRDLVKRIRTRDEELDRNNWFRTD